MNRDRRRVIERLIDELEEIRVQINQLENEEQESLDNLPDSFKGGDKGQAMDGYIQNLNDADTDLDNVLGYLQNTLF